MGFSHIFLGSDYRRRHVLFQADFFQGEVNMLQLYKAIFLKKESSLLCGLLVLFLSLCSRKPPDITDEYTCNWNGTDSLQYLYTIACPQEYKELAGSPFMPTLSNVSSIKVVYEIATKRLFFVSSAVYALHFNFCQEVLGYPRNHGDFNREQYTDSPDRLYWLASVNHYKSSGIYTLEFIPDDRVSAQGVATTFFAVRDSAFFGDEMLLSLVSSRFEAIADSIPQVPVIHKDQLYSDQVYQALNTEKAYGWLKKISVGDIPASHLTRHDILVTDGLPLDIPVVAGIITTEFQTPLSHINVLSHNRGTPNMAFKTAWTDKAIDTLAGKLVFLEVLADSFTLREADISEAQSFWESRETHLPVTLECHDDTSGLFGMENLSHSSLHLVGAKAANFAELCKIRLGNQYLPVPENAFAIPFYYYRHHIESNGIDAYMDSLLSDSLIYSDYQYRTEKLSRLRKKIISAPLDADFVAAVEQRIDSMGTYRKMRFRSSTNAEDVEGFNGAGLYDSYTGDLDDTNKGVAGAIRKVYASLWTQRGFDEREYFRIDQRSVAMGILVHRSFPDEEVNGVAITQNIYRPEISAYTINAQVDEISVVQPPAGTICDQLLFYTYSGNMFENPSIEYITVSNQNGGARVMSEGEVVELARWLNAIHNRFYLVTSATSRSTFAMDVEFKLDKGDRKLYIKQARPY